MGKVDSQNEARLSTSMFYSSKMLLHFKNSTHQRRLRSEIEAEFCTFWPL